MVGGNKGLSFPIDVEVVVEEYARVSGEEGCFKGLMYGRDVYGEDG